MKNAVITGSTRGIGLSMAKKNMLSQGSGQIWNMEGLGSNDMMVNRYEVHDTICYGSNE